MSSDQYSQNAKQALRMGHYIARQLQHVEVDTDHLFAGILHTEGSVGFQVLEYFQLDFDHVLDMIETFHQYADHESEKLPFTEALRDSLAAAIAEAKWLNHDYIGTEHFLLGLLRIGGGRLHELMREFDITADQVRGRIKRLVQDGLTEITMESARRMAKLSELGKRVLNAAEYIAIMHQHEQMTPLHLLLALAQERRGIAFEALPHCGLDSVTLQNDLKQLPRLVPGAKSLVNHLIDGAVDRAEILGTHYTGTEHLLLAMTVDPDGQEILRLYGLDLKCLQQYLRDVLLERH